MGSSSRSTSHTAGHDRDYPAPQHPVHLAQLDQEIDCVRPNDEAAAYDAAPIFRNWAIAASLM
jgi:hypothetical protein